MLVIIESPFGAKDPAVLEENKRYLDECLADSLKRGEAPYASHKLYPGVLDDNVPDQRRQGMEAGFAWGERGDLVAVYVDRGLSAGMVEGVKKAQARGQKVVFRSVKLGNMGTL
jgi:hypothetical protein